MRRQASLFGLLGLSVVLLGQTPARAVITTTPTQTDTVPMNTQTNWGPTTPSLQGLDPLVFKQFDPTLGTLQSINMTMTYTVTNEAKLTFTSPSETTITVTTALPSNPNQGTTLTLNGPADTPNVNIFTAMAPVLTYTRTFAGASPSSPVVFSTSPSGNEILITNPDAPGSSNTQTGMLTKTFTDPGNIGLFTGTGTVDLPAHAVANSSFTTTTGNGGGMVMTYAGMSVSLSYTYNSAVPEPSSLALLGLGAGGMFLARRQRRRAMAL